MHVFTRGERIVPVDYHIHTTYSDGKSSIEEYILRAKEIGLKEIAITDHVWRISDWVDDYVNEIKELSEKHEFKVHAGLEAKAVDLDGNIDVSSSDRKKVDFVMGVVHRMLPDESEINDLFNLEAAEIQQIEVELIERMISKGVDVVGHPMRVFYKYKNLRCLNCNPDIRFIERVAEFAANHDAILEWNAKLPDSIRTLKLYVNKGCAFTLGTDAHKCDELAKGDFSKVNKVVSRWVE